MKSENWIPVFRTGTHTDASGNEKTWTEAELDIIVQKYQPQAHEAPAVIGHPEHNSPAWGWVEGLRREGNVLFAQFKGLVPEFVEMVRKGLFKKRSISLYPDRTLRHVGFLGAMPPAVKGLPDVAFADKEGKFIEFNFDCKQCNRCANNFCGNAGAEDFQPLPRKEAKGMKWFEWMKKKAQDEGVTLEDAPVNFSAPNPPPAPASGGQYSSPPAVDIKALVDAEVAKVVTAKTSEFAETQRTLDAEKARLKAEGEKLEKAKGERMKDEIKSFCEGLCKEGKLTPAMMKYGMGMTNFLESISGVETAIEFSEGAEKKKQTPVEYAKAFLGSFKKQIEFGEFANAGNDIPKDEDKREAAIKNYQEKNKKDGVEITYKEAVLAVSKAQPELFKS